MFFSPCLLSTFKSAGTRGGGMCGFSWIREVSLDSTKKKIFLYYPSIQTVSVTDTAGYQTNRLSSFLADRVSFHCNAYGIWVILIPFFFSDGLGSGTWGSPGPWPVRSWLRDLQWRICCSEKRTHRKRCPLFTHWTFSCLNGWDAWSSGNHLVTRRKATLREVTCVMSGKKDTELLICKWALN